MCDNGKNERHELFVNDNGNDDDNDQMDLEEIDEELGALDDDDSIFESDDEEEIDFAQDIDFDINYEYELLCDNNVDVEFMFDIDKLRQNQYKDPFLLIVRNVINRTDRQNEARWLPPKMKSDVRNNRYFINEQDILMIHYQHNGKDLIVLPPEHIKAFLHYYHHTNAPFFVTNAVLGLSDSLTLIL